MRGEDAGKAENEEVRVEGGHGGDGGGGGGWGGGGFGWRRPPALCASRCQIEQTST